ncbi:Histone acetyltransferase kat2b [Homalodisca vitripennis]|nr:Histone acetyltransferase kat2b [Homalodisca vitripennis]
MVGGVVVASHTTHLKSLQEEEVNRLLGMVVDVENIFMSMHREEDPDTKKVYYYLFKLLRKCIVDMTKPTIEGPLGQPPFERPSIAKAITNFVLYKFSHAAAREWTTMYDLAKMLLHCLNHWNFETPSARRQTVSAEEISAYKVNYTRWLVFCHVPVFCDSLPHFETTLVFGRTLLRAVFRSVRRQLMDKCHSERDRMPPEKRVLQGSLLAVYTLQLNLPLGSAKTNERHITYRKCPDSGVHGQFDRSRLLRDMTVGVGGVRSLTSEVLASLNKGVSPLPALTGEAGSELASPSSGGT